ncbi:MAG: hypothetical protein UX85_C0003G0175 [Candidatus Beckwithbacteria bacterium GW2011_GWB1_47_15]|uniref:Uncharacterized protein n=1 Tax=Candidatus Beckwithbacteria bacterium GW2011_GWB1_47_15 TaxID=1618371 RepID=A0A0G1RWM0_9BACT|nr:MAG: hypothetical protein UY43_C0001G0285 [Candidatus Beckwithbacteria bacterium GW2011_GWC1_49_16]KKU35206.1 MAG: hypothetical protein UX50_C0005G0029 [Candidatus Beckwithbacteria bacterium GW2011_GWA1_46_30]KKU61516.1 MAG: hypothetical protein UX85_C0003G0175 [Candidatus Beckwithbacteria bacterium GW2011_GWB1_47_15]KKU71720.1 MAG: hypothetical protein UX97_C0004G0043 [Candidatus Beckwithbacteria bacterium GW2011_GWA2_47_25]KKW03818.1 MAG: hypothetical protein UY37_C0004G0111 [Candidatus Be
MFARMKYKWLKNKKKILGFGGLSVAVVGLAVGVSLVQRSQRLESQARSEQVNPCGYGLDCTDKPITGATSCVDQYGGNSYCCPENSIRWYGACVEKCGSGLSCWDYPVQGASRCIVITNKITETYCCPKDKPWNLNGVCNPAPRRFRPNPVNKPTSSPEGESGVPGLPEVSGQPIPL